MFQWLQNDCLAKKKRANGKTKIGSQLSGGEPSGTNSYHRHFAYQRSLKPNRLRLESTW